MRHRADCPGNMRLQAAPNPDGRRADCLCFCINFVAYILSWFDLLCTLFTLQRLVVSKMMGALVHGYFVLFFAEADEEHKAKPSTAQNSPVEPSTAQHSPVKPSKAQ